MTIRWATFYNVGARAKEGYFNHALLNEYVPYVNYIDVCNYLFTHRLSLYPCKSPWVKLDYTNLGLYFYIPIATTIYFYFLLLCYCDG